MVLSETTSRLHRLLGRAPGGARWCTRASGCLLLLMVADGDGAVHARLPSGLPLRTPRPFLRHGHQQRQLLQRAQHGRPGLGGAHRRGGAHRAARRPLAALPPARAARLTLVPSHLTAYRYFNALCSCPHSPCVEGQATTPMQSCQHAITSCGSADCVHGQDGQRCSLWA